MFALTFDLDGIDELERAAKDADDVLLLGVLSAVTEGAERGESEAKANHPYQDRSGTLTNSIGSNVEVEGSGATAILSARTPYASYVEGGTKPHDIRAQAGGVLAWHGPNGPRFAREVHHPGTQPLPFMQPAAEVAARYITDYIEARVLPAVGAELTRG
jgi:hypothetical protein